ncbi:MAG: DNA repair exonuclease [Lachnospiraceae bacterium]|nr:DNA repair exonuclease [Lachnospiraceae bacterium]
MIIGERKTEYPNNKLKLIHCADLHLDSAMDTHLSKEKAKERKLEILETFSSMVSYAHKNDIDHILIAGDMFDKKAISATARNFVYSQIKDHPEINFYYLKGNHDVDGFLNKLDEIPENLFLFGENWKTYNIATGSRNVMLSAVELTSLNAPFIYNGLFLDPKDFNIVMLHGQDANYKSKDKAEIIALNELKNKSIDYLALGHIHTYKLEQLDARGKYCYPGCLEGRGFDECGKHGFVVLNINLETGEYENELVLCSKRNTYELPVDISNLESSAEIIKKVDEAFLNQEVTENDLIKIVLEGEVNLDSEIDTDFVVKHFEPDFYFVKCSNKTKIHVDYNSFVNDKSLKGEFVRSVMADTNLSEEEKAKVILYGIRALGGEVID